MQYRPTIYSAQKTNSPIHIDGKDDEKAWKTATTSSEFDDIEGHHKKAPHYETHFKMLWDDQNLYIYARLNEPHIWGNLKQHDAIIYHNNDFEIFIKPYENSPIYYEIEINTLNTILDLMMNKPYRFGGEAKLHWDIKGLQSAVHIQGTNNNPSDTDQYWAVEMAIPFSALQSFGRKPKPDIGDSWRLNFSRVQWEHAIIDGQYQRKKVNGKLIPEDNWVWNPIGLINMHYPERWGFLQFTDTDPQKVSYPNSYAIENFTWNLHYLQSLYRQKHHKYSATMEDLKIIHPFLDKEYHKYECEVITNNNQTFYRIEIKDKENKILTSIDSQGNYNIQYVK